MADKPHVLIHSAWYKPAMDRIDELAHTHHVYQADDPDAFIAEWGPKCTVIGTMHHCPQDFMEKVPNLKLVLNFGVGYDGVHLPTANAVGAKVVNTPAVLNDCVADMALALALSARRRVVDADRYARAGKWVSEGNYPYVLKFHHSKVGILGLGRIGTAIAKRCEGFGCEVVYHSRNKKPDAHYQYYGDLVAMAKEVDVLIVITPGGDATRNLVNEPVLEALGPKGLLVNVARGSVVDTSALVKTLGDGRLGAAALDVFPDEPNIPAELLQFEENLVLTPHIASASHDTRYAMGMVLYDNLKAMIEGKPLLTPVN